MCLLRTLHGSHFSEHDPQAKAGGLSVHLSIDEFSLKTIRLVKKMYTR
jgi:hypothetical protein